LLTSFINLAYIYTKAWSAIFWSCSDITLSAHGVTDISRTVFKIWELWNRKIHCHFICS